MLRSVIGDIISYQYISVILIAGVSLKSSDPGQGWRVRGVWPTLESRGKNHSLLQAVFCLRHLIRPWAPATIHGASHAETPIVQPSGQERRCRALAERRHTALVSHFPAAAPALHRGSLDEDARFGWVDGQETERTQHLQGIAYQPGVTQQPA